MVDQYDFEIRYWGTTGTLPRPLSPGVVTEKIVSTLEYLRDADQLHRLLDKAMPRLQLERFIRKMVPAHLCSTPGGNTSCIQIQTPDCLFIVDAGSGLRPLGAHLNQVWNASNYPGSREAHLFITHAHMDHTIAIAFAEPFHDAANDFTIWAPQHVLDRLTKLFGSDSELRSVYFPIDFAQLKGVKQLRPIMEDQPVDIGDTSVRAFALNHPGGCTGYRFERGSSSIVFASDHEQTDVPDRTLMHFSQGADLLYADAQYRQAEYEGIEGISGDAAMSRRGWGHSTVEASVQTAVAAGVQRLHLGHHDPKRTDSELAAIEAMAAKLTQQLLADDHRGANDCLVAVAREDMLLRI